MKSAQHYANLCRLYSVLNTCNGVNLERRAAECRTCQEIAKTGFGPSHNGSSRCQSGSIASGGTHAHCACDTCF
jgi:hypothetical protein